MVSLLNVKEDVGMTKTIKRCELASRKRSDRVKTGRSHDVSGQLEGLRHVVTRRAPRGWFKELTPVFDFLLCVFLFISMCASVLIQKRKKNELKDKPDHCCTGFCVFQSRFMAVSAEA